MSFTGNFVDATLALRIGLVNEVVPHADLMSTPVQRAIGVTSTDGGTLRRIREIYDLVANGSGADGRRAELESRGGELALASPEAFAARRDAVVSRGRQQAAGD